MGNWTDTLLARRRGERDEFTGIDAHVDDVPERPPARELLADESTIRDQLHAWQPEPLVAPTSNEPDVDVDALKRELEEALAERDVAREARDAALEVIEQHATGTLNGEQRSE